MHQNINSHNIVNLHKKEHIDVEIEKSVIGFVIFIVIFLIIIPVVLFKNQMYTVLEAYLPNLDILATVISWGGGPFGIWTHLYQPSPLSMYGFYSQTLINYMSLLGLTYIITRETKRTNSVEKGWSMAFIMLLMTYLLPGQFISYLMDKVSNVIPSTFVVIIVGFLISAIIIGAETFILHKFRKNLAYIAYNILNVPKLLKN